MERICNRCEKSFDTNSLYESLIKRRIFSRCKECIIDVQRRERVKKFLLKNYSKLSIKEKNFISNYTDINISVPKINNPHEENLPKRNIKGDDIQCITCLRYLSRSKFYTHSNGNIFKRCKTCHQKIPRKKRNIEKKPGFIYIIKNKTWEGYYKIGKTRNIDNRLGQYQTSSPFSSE